MARKKTASGAGSDAGGGVISAVARLFARVRGFRFWRRGSAQQSSAFTSAFVGLAAKMAKADGVAVRAEWEAFARFLETPPSEAAGVRRIYDLAKRDTAGFEIYSARIGNLLREEPELLRRVLECLIYIACADGVLHPAEDAFLAIVAEKFGLTPEEFRHIRAFFVRDAESPYEILGVSPAAGDGEIKAHYRRLVRELHPDRLMASGAQPAIIKAATAKLAAINSAYEAIIAERAKEKRA